MNLKCITLVFVWILMVVLIGSCTEQPSMSVIDEPVPNQEKGSASNGIQIALQEVVYDKSPNEITVDLQNESNQACGYGSFYRVEVNQGGTWHMVNYAENTFEEFPYFNDMGYTLDPTEKVIQNFSLERYGLYLSPGNYRLTKTLLCPPSGGNEQTLSVPFEVMGKN